MGIKKDGSRTSLSFYYRPKVKMHESLSLLVGLCQEKDTTRVKLDQNIGVPTMF